MYTARQILQFSLKLYNNNCIIIIVIIIIAIIHYLILIARIFLTCYPRLSPGHECALQTRCSFSAPGHMFPPCCGGGCVQLRDRVCVPDPQDLVQVVHTPHPDQPP